MEPKIRFKGFNQEWGKTTLAKSGKFFSGIGFPEKEQGGNKGFPFYKVSDMNNVGNEKIMTNSNNYVTFEQVNRNGWNVCTNVPAIYFAKVGAAVLLNRKRLVLEPCLCDNNTMLYSFDKTIWDTLFCQSYFETIDLAKLVQVGSLPSYNGSMVGGINISLPSFNEQKILGTYFKYLDSLVQSTTKKIELLKQVKAASLQSMFPQEGETSPRVRFKGFKGEWKETTLGTLFTERCESDINAEMLSVTINQGIIKASENGRFDTSNSDKSKYKLVKIGDIAYNSMRLWQGACGCSQYEGIVSPAYTVVAPHNNVCSLFFYYMFKTNQMLNTFRLNSQGLTSDTWNLKYPIFSKLHVFCPSNIDEQQAIGTFLENLDSQITLQSQRLEKLKQIKSACLDNMFV